MAASLLFALVWVFAASSIILTLLILSTLVLAIRHRRRRRKGIYTAILEMTPSSQVSRVLTVGDLIVDPSLQQQIRQGQQRAL